VHHLARRRDEGTPLVEMLDASAPTPHRRTAELHPAPNSGFTMIEVLVTISLMGILMAMAVGGWSAWTRASEQSGTARELQSTMREAQQRAVTEGMSMCVKVSSSSYTVWRGSCTSATPIAANRVEGPVQAGRGVQILSGAFPYGVTFTPRGTSTDGSVTVTRTGSSKVYTLQIEGFTGRVSLA
jgi:prepilin-type N-terminal cleavage/methylation domain-containing protein